MTTASRQRSDAPPNTRALLRDRNLLSLFAVTLAAMSAVSAISPAFPALSRALGVPEARVGWLITFYTLPGIALTPLWGVLADRHGRKRALVAALTVFGAAGGACALAPDFGWLLALRLVQGIGGAALFTLSIAIIGDLFRDGARVKCLGFNSAVAGVGGAIFPALGGALAAANWRYPFALAALALPAALLVAFTLRIPEPKDRRDLGEFLRGVAGSVRHPEVLTLLALTMLYYFALLGALLTYLPTLAENGFGVSSAVVGTLLSARAVALTLTAGGVGKASERLAPERLVQIALGGALLGLALFPVLTALTSSVWWLLAPALLMGFASGLYGPTRATILHAAAPAHLRAAVISLDQSVKRLGQSLGPVALGVVFGVAGTDAVFYAGALAVGLALALALWRVRPG